jgi:hypothetical protein
MTTDVCVSSWFPENQIDGSRQHLRIESTLEMAESERQISWRMDGTDGPEDTDHGGGRYVYL